MEKRTIVAWSSAKKTNKPGSVRYRCNGYLFQFIQLIKSVDSICYSREVILLVFFSIPPIRFCFIKKNTKQKTKQNRAHRIIENRIPQEITANGIQFQHLKQIYVFSRLQKQARRITLPMKYSRW